MAQKVIKNVTQNNEEIDIKATCIKTAGDSIGQLWHMRADELEERLPEISEKMNKEVKAKSGFEFITEVKAFNPVSLMDAVLFPNKCWFKKGAHFRKRIDNVIIGKIEIGKEVKIFDADDEGDDPFLMHSEPLWETKPITLIRFVGDYLVLYSEDKTRYEISFKEHPVFHLFDNE